MSLFTAMSLMESKIKQSARDCDVDLLGFAFVISDGDKTLTVSDGMDDPAKERTA